MAEVLDEAAMHQPDIRSIAVQRAVADGVDAVTSLDMWIPLGGRSSLPVTRGVF